MYRGTKGSNSEAWVCHPPVMRGRKLATVAAAIWALVACSPSSPEPAQSANDLPEDPLVQMEIAFNGDQSPDEIREALDLAFAATSTEATSDNYSRAGSVLVTLRQEYAIDEMEILECIPSLADDETSALTFPDAAALCVAELVVQ